MRILLYTHEFPPDIGGAGQFLRDLAVHLARLGHDVHVAVGRPAWRVEEPHAPGDPPELRVTRFAAGAREHLDYATVGLRVRGFVRAWRADVVIVGDGKSMLGAGGVPLPRHVAVVPAAYGTEALGFMRTRVRRFFYARLLKQADGVIPCSEYAGRLAADAFRELGLTPPPMCPIPAGIEVDAFRVPVDTDAVAAVRARYALGEGPLVVGLGRLVPRKGFDAGLHAVARAAGNVPGLRYAIAGDGPDRARLEGIARDLGILDEHVRFLGRIPAEDKIPLLDASDAFMLLSRREGNDVEGFGIVFAEAAMRGKPVVAGAHGGVTEAVEDGTTGFLVEPKDGAAAGDALARLLADPDLAERMGEAGRQRALERFDWNTLGKRVSTFLEDLVAQ